MRHDATNVKLGNVNLISCSVESFLRTSNESRTGREWDKVCTSVRPVATPAQRQPHPLIMDLIHNPSNYFIFLSFSSTLNRNGSS